MDYLARESAPFSPETWEKIDSAVIDNAKKHMVCRRFLNIYGPLGPGASTVPVDGPNKAESLENGLGRITGRKLVELPQFYEDFTLLWRDIEESEKLDRPLDLSAAASAAQRSAKREDELILFGNKALGAEGLMTAAGSYKIKRGTWNEGEDAYKDVAHAIAYLSSNSKLGRYALVLSPELYLDLQRLQPNVGLLELDRISKELEIYPGADKVSLMLNVPHRPGALYGMIARFAALGLNLTKLESRPIAGTDFEFMFYFDLDASVYDEDALGLLCELDEGPEAFTYLGSYSEG